jgi:hypothetical protein
VGQVPAASASPFGIVGDGRVARHFTHYLGLLGLPFGTWSRRTGDKSPGEALAPCGTVLLLISDDAIVPFAEAWPDPGRKRFVHFSGSLVTPVAEGAHPLMTFGEKLYDLPTYRSVPFVLESGRTPFAELLPGLPNPSFTVPPADRPYYHALCVMAGNFSVILWRKLFDDLRDRWGIPPSAALPYLKQVAANLGADPGRALTGPLARKDRDVIATNLRALEGDPFRDIYAAFVRAYEQHP